MKKISAFTLAEVLITLGVIGIVASMTIPTLIQNTQQKETVVALKKAFNVLSQAYELSVMENGATNNWDLSTPVTTSAYFSPYLKVVKNCGMAEGCFPNQTYSNFVGSGGENLETNTTSRAKMQLVDGTLLAFNGYGTNTYERGSTPALKTVRGVIIVDVNGFKKPNSYAKDTFLFYITNYGVVPIGTAAEDAAVNRGFDADCKKGAADIVGHGCTAWVIYNENQEYTKCTNLGWNGNKTCN